MKIHRVLGFLFGSLLFSTASVLAQAPAKPTKATAEVQKSYDVFIADFRKALKANDAAAVTALTKFPFHWRETRDAANFRKKAYPKIFTAKIRSCIARGKSVYDRDGEGNDSFLIFCGEEIFYFTKTADGFRFSDIHVND